MQIHVKEIEFEIHKDILVRDLSCTLPCRRGCKRRSGGSQSVLMQRTEVIAYRYPSFPISFHAEINNVCLHVKSSKDFYTTRSSPVAYVLFREAPWFNDCLPPNVDTESLEIQTTENVTYRRTGNHTLFEIAIDGSPGKFIRLKSAIQTVLQYADEQGIKHVLFPLDFRYGNHQIELHLSSRYSYYDSNVIPLLYFKAISDYALYSRPCSLQTMHIYFLPERQHAHTNYDSKLWNYKRVMNASPFRSICTTMPIDSLFQACHLSVVPEISRVTKQKWKRSEHSKKYELGETSTSGPLTQRYTYGRSGCISPKNVPIGSRRISPVNVPIELLLER